MVFVFIDCQSSSVSIAAVCAQTGNISGDTRAQKFRGTNKDRSGRFKAHHGRKMN
jgi:hypothetical protein